MDKLKTLANCTPVEFLQQTNKIRHAAAGWLAESGILEIRRRQPALTGKEAPEELAAAREAQARKNLSDMLDAAMEQHAEETAKVLGMLCFMEPAELKKANGLELLAPAMELLASKPVTDFLLSLAKLGLTDMQT